MAGDGQVTLGNTVLKQSAKKIRRLYNDSILAGFAGSAADSFALFARFEAKLEQYRGNLERSAVELARDWRTDRLLRRLEAMLIVAVPRSFSPAPAISSSLTTGLWPWVLADRLRWLLRGRSPNTAGSTLVRLRRKRWRSRRTFAFIRTRISRSKSYETDDEWQFFFLNGRRARSDR
jgi:hypothetical protein